MQSKPQNDLNQDRYALGFDGAASFFLGKSGFPQGMGGEGVEKWGVEAEFVAEVAFFRQEAATGEVKNSLIWLVF